MTPARPTIRRSIQSPGTPLDVDRILIIRLGALGDVVRTLPAVQAIRERYAHARITWLVEPGAAAILEGQSLIDQVLVFPRDELSRSFSQGRWVEAGRNLYSFVRDLRKEKFELVLDFHSILKVVFFRDCQARQSESRWRHRRSGVFVALCQLSYWRRGSETKSLRAECGSGTFSWRG